MTIWRSQTLHIHVPPLKPPRLSLEEIISVHQPAIIYLNILFPPLWYVLGFPGNIMSFLVWMRPKMSQSSGVYLASLALSDTIFLALHVVYWLQATWSINVLYFPVICEVFPVFFMSSQYLNPLFVLAFTTERFVAVCYPFHRDKITACTTRLTVVTMVSISLGLSVVQAYFWTYDSKAGVCRVRSSVLVGGQRSVWYNWSLISELLVFLSVPLIITVLNVRVLNVSNRLKKFQQRMMAMYGGQRLGQSPGGSTTTYMLLAVSFYLIFTTLPVTIFYVFNILFEEGDYHLTHEQIANDPTWQRYLTFNLLRTLVDRLCMSHNSLNFYIYTITGPQFRRELKYIYLKYFCRKSRDQIRSTEQDDLLATFKPPNQNKTNNGKVAETKV